MSALLFIYWLAFSAKIEMPAWINTFIWTVIDVFAQGLKPTPFYKDITPVLPVLTSGVFIIITYFANCIMLLLENNHKRFLNCVDNYKAGLEKTVNEELHKDFLEGLKKIQFLLVKIKIVVTKHNSYLTAMTDEEVDAEKMEKDIGKLILSTLNSEIILKKGFSDGSVYFLLSDLTKSKEFFSTLVSKSSKLINAYIKPKLDIGFYCGGELFEELAQYDEKSNYLNRILNLKISNKIVITPKFKVYYDNIMPDYYTYSVLGEYNLTDEICGANGTMLHAIQRKN